MSIDARTDLAIEFLHHWCPNGPWVLSACTPNREKITNHTFVGSEHIELTDWINSFQGIRNLYFTVNTVKSGLLHQKPKKLDISEIVTLHVDCDPRAGEDFESERVRILKSLQEFTPHPSVIVDSGGGYQAFWRLEEPIPLDGTEACALEFESYSQQLELVLGADRTANCDRLMRLPGTLNIPNAIKVRKGRTVSLSSVLEWIDTKYPLTSFIKAPTRVQQVNSATSEKLGGGGEKVRFTGSVSPVYLEDLSKKNITIPDNIKVLIVQGNDPDEPNKYSSRSEVLWAVVCALVRAGADDDTVAGVIMNKDNAVSASVLDKPRPEKYAAKQIQDAKEEAHDPMLRELNSRHAVISDLGGKCRIISEKYDHALRRPCVSYSTFEDFKNRYCNRKVAMGEDKDGKAILKPAGQWWINHEQRRQYDTIVFAPGREIPNAYNLWQGFACEAIPGDCELFLSHIRENICKGVKEHIDYIFGWMARAVQQPDCAGEVAIVLRGEMGTGKGAFAKHLGSLFGRHFLQVADSKHLVGNFNSHLRDCVLLMGDEAFYAGDKKHEAVLKALVTEETLAIEAKGVDVVASPNYTHLILASNSAWVVPAGANERRFFVLDVSAQKMQDKKYFAAIQEQMNRGGREALLHFLLNFDISNFEVREVPKTLALQEQKLLSYSSEETWWYEKLDEGRILRDHERWEDEVMKNELQDDYIFFMQRTGIMRKASATVLGKFLSRVCPGGIPRSYQKKAKVKKMGTHGEEYVVEQRTYFYELPSLESCRENWDKNHGGPFNWNAPLDKGVQPELSQEKEAFK